MKTLLLLVLIGQDNPLEPKYPFTSCKITYKPLKSGKDEATMEAYFKGSRAVVIMRHTREGKLKETSYDYVDAKSVLEVIVDATGKVTNARKQTHPGSLLAEDYSKLSADARKTFAENLPKLWRKWAPLFDVDWLREEPKVGGAEKICGKDCEVFEYPRAKYWRWQGTNIMLKGTHFGITFEADRIEENASIADSIFDLPKVDAWEDEDIGGTTERLACKIFEMLAGEAPEPRDEDAPEPSAKIKLTLAGKEHEFAQPAAIFVADDETIEIDADGNPGFRGLVRAKGAKKLADAAGKEFDLTTGEDDQSTFHFELGDDVALHSKTAKLKIVSVDKEFVQIEIGGTFTRVDRDGEQDVTIEKVTFKAKIEE